MEPWEITDATVSMRQRIIVWEKAEHFLIRDEKNVENAEIVREKGTNRSKFFRGQIDKYTWVEAGSSYLPSELNAAYLYAQLEVADKINEKRLSIWNRYWDGLEKLSDEGKIVRPTIPEGCAHNAHMFYLKARDLEERTALISYLKEQGYRQYFIIFHYIQHRQAGAMVCLQEKTVIQRGKARGWSACRYIIICHWNRQTM